MSAPPLTTEQAAKLARWDQRVSFPVLLAALAPIVVVLSGGRDLVWAAVAVVSWLVFVVDLVVRMRLRPSYLRTGWGKVDLAVVIATAPWFLIPGLSTSRLLGLFRLARVARLGLASHALRRLFSRLNRVVIFAAFMVFTCSLVVTEAEGPASGFDDYGDGLWWGIVTLTTVGYGDLVPVTTVGRITGAILMVTGIGILGVLAGSLAQFFRLGSEPTPGAGPAPTPEPDLHAQMAALSEQLAALQQRLDHPGDGDTGQGP